MKLKRRDLIKAAVGAAALATIKSPAIGQTAWPQAGRTVKVIVPWPPGAAYDALGRLVAQRIQDKYGVTALVIADFAFIFSFYLLGGDFWGKVRALFTPPGLN